MDILNYKIFSGRYIKYETKRKVKEFSLKDDALVFEGEYLNGKRNREGKDIILRYLMNHF